MKKIFSFLCLALLVITSGCIENDIDYAIVPLSISELTVEGQVGNTVISKDRRTATVTLGESVNRKKVKITNIQYSAEYKKDTANVTVEPIRTSLTTDVIDLSAPYSVTLSLYQDYEWKIVAEQSIERILKVEGQIGGASIVDEENKIITAYIAKDGDLHNIVVEELKLGPEGSEIDINALEWTYKDNSAEAIVEVWYNESYHEVWTVRVERLTNDVMTFPAHPWVNVSWLYGIGLNPSESTFEYRELGTENWNLVSNDRITSTESGEFSARINGLKANTQYEYRAVYKDDYAASVSFTTHMPEEIPNMGFEDWSMQEKKVICPWAEGDDSYWDCGNWGSTTLGAKYNITTADENVRPGSNGKYSARLETKSILGILATGNMFIGKYKKTIGFNGLLGMGRSFTSYPTRLTGYYKYHGEIIDKVSKGYESFMNKPDSCFIYIVLGDWKEDGEGTYVKIQTDKGKNEGTYFDVNDPHIIAYGSLATDKRIDDFTKFSIELDYRAIDRRPTAIMMVFAASKYGDYFTGAPGSILWIDDLNLEYDY